MIAERLIPGNPIEARMMERKIYSGELPSLTIAEQAELLKIIANVIATQKSGVSPKQHDRAKGKKMRKNRTGNRRG